MASVIRALRRWIASMTEEVLELPTVVATPLREVVMLPGTVDARRIHRRTMDDPALIFEVRPVDGIPTITEIDGGALRVLGTPREAWIGQPLPEPYLSELYLPAVAGGSSIGTGVLADRQILIMYSALGDLATGEIVGASGRTWVIPDGYKVAVTRDD